MLLNPGFSKELLNCITENESFLIFGHQEPDGDCLGSQLAMASFLTRLGKKVKLYNQGPFKREEINDYAPRFLEKLEPLDLLGNPVVVILDCSTFDRIGAFPSQLLSLTIVVIDHHTSGLEFGTHRGIFPKAPSTTFLVQALIETLGSTPTAEEATYLMLGLCTDTGFFRHLEAGMGDSFTAAAALTQAGASPKATFARINGGRKLPNCQLMGLILSRTEGFFDNKVLFSYEYLEDRGRLGAENRESDTIYQVLQSVQNNEMICLIREESATKCTVGLRSKAIIDVGVLAQKFGGGGHIRASGFAVEMKLLDLKKAILDFVSPSFQP